MSPQPSDLLGHYDTAKFSYALRTPDRIGRDRESASGRREAGRKLAPPGDTVVGSAWGPSTSAVWSFHRSRHARSGDRRRDHGALGGGRDLPAAQGENRPKTFHRAAERSCGYVSDVVGDKDLASYTKADANVFRDALVSRGMAGSSVTRIFGTGRAVTILTSSELGLSLLLPGAAEGKPRRRAAPAGEPPGETRSG